MAQGGGVGGGSGGHRRRRHHGIGDFPFPHIQGPSPGSYDPGLAAQVGQSQRGLLDTLFDIRRQNRQARRDTHHERRLDRRDTRRSLRDLGISRHERLGDIGYERQGTQTSFARDLADLAQAEQRGTEDFNTAMTNLGRKYTNLASAQTQSANARGALEGGFAAQSAAKRAANQAVEAQPIQTDYSRMREDTATRESRAREDLARQLGHYDVLTGRVQKHYGIEKHRTKADLHTQLRQLHLNLARQLQANRTRRSRAIREQGLYALDQAQQEFYQAHQQNPHIHFPSLPNLRAGVNPHGHLT